MNANLLKTALCACGLAAAGLPAFAGSLQRADVPAGAAWVIHVDCDSLRPTAMGQYIIGEMEKPDAQASFAALQVIFNFDPRKQLHGLTLYNTGKAPEDGVLLVYADFDPERLITMAKAGKDYQSSSYKQHVIHNWTPENKKGKGDIQPQVYASIQGAHIVVFAQQEVRVVQALAVLDRAAPSLAGSSVFPELGAHGSSSYLQAAARKLDLPDSEPSTALFRLAKTAHLQIGEAQGRLRATLHLEANDDEVAKQMTWVGRGLVALMTLQRSNPGVVTLGDAIAIKQEGAGVVASLAIPTSDAVEMLKADAARKARKKAEKD